MLNEIIAGVSTCSGFASMTQALRPLGSPMRASVNFVIRARVQGTETLFV